MKKIVLLILLLLLFPLFAAPRAEYEAAARKNYDIFVKRIKSKSSKQLTADEKRFFIWLINKIYSSPRGKKLLAFSDRNLDFKVSNSVDPIGMYAKNTLYISRPRIRDCMDDFRKNGEMDSAAGIKGLINTLAHEMTHGIFSRLRESMKIDTRNCPRAVRVADNKLDELCADIEGMRIVDELYDKPDHKNPYSLLSAKMREGLSVEDARTFVYSQYLARLWSGNTGKPIIADGRKFLYPQGSYKGWCSIYMGAYFLSNHCYTVTEPKKLNEFAGRDFRKNARMFLDYMDLDVPEELFRDPENGGFKLTLADNESYMKTGRLILKSEVYVDGKVYMEVFPTRVVSLIIIYSEYGISIADVGYTGNLKSGRYTHRFDGGKLKLVTTDKLKKAVFRRYDTHGKLIMEIPFKDGKPNGTVWVMRNGRKFFTHFNGRKQSAEHIQDYSDNKMVIVAPEEKKDFFQWKIRLNLADTPEYAEAFVKFVEKLASSEYGRKLLAELPDDTDFTSYKVNGVKGDHDLFCGSGVLSPMAEISILSDYLAEYCRADSTQKEKMEKSGAMLIAQAILGYLNERIFRYVYYFSGVYSPTEQYMARRLKFMVKQAVSECVRFELDPQADTTFARVYRAAKKSGMSDARAFAKARQIYAEILWQNTPGLAVNVNGIKVMPCADLPLWDGIESKGWYWFPDRVSPAGFAGKYGDIKYKSAPRKQPSALYEKAIRRFLNHHLIALDPEFFLDINNSSFICRYPECSETYRDGKLIETIFSRKKPGTSGVYDVLSVKKGYYGNRLNQITFFVSEVRDGVYKLPCGSNRLEITVAARNASKSKVSRDVSHIREIDPDGKTVMEIDMINKKAWYCDGDGTIHKFTLQEETLRYYAVKLLFLPESDTL